MFTLGSVPEAKAEPENFSGPDEDFHREEDGEKKKNFETFLFNSEGQNYFFVIMYGPN
jgi:hypothetical protein